jgi:hypothetical protein
MFHPSSVNSIPMGKATRAICAGGLVSGSLDISAALIVYGLFGVTPIRLLQGIARGLIGVRAYEGGWASASLGLCLHFIIAFTATAVYVVASRSIPALLYAAYLSGALYAVAVYCFMQCLVIPLSAARKTPFSLKMTVVGLVIHVFCVGLPISLISRRYLLS